MFKIPKEDLRDYIVNKKASLKYNPNISSSFIHNTLETT